MATMANHDRATSQATCQNCETHTTPLWRRDETGAVLCNACGLFLKLHGRPRPISLKTDVIKSRNRVKSIRPDLAKQKKAQAQAQQQQHLNQTGDMNGADLGAVNGARRASQKSANGVMDDTNSPISRTGTPNLYASHMGPMYQNLEDQFQAQHLSGFGGPDGRAPSPLNGDRLDMPQTNEQILATNASLKTRVSELEVIQELYRGRIQQLEQEEANRQAQEKSKAEANEQLHTQLSVMNESHAQLQKELEESHRRENMLKRRLDELEVELKEAKESLDVQDNSRAKKPRLNDASPTTEEAELPSLPAS
jgi:GATA-binding protein